jgi:hypothetical protein
MTLPYPSYHHARSSTFGNLMDKKWADNLSFFTQYHQ